MNRTHPRIRLLLALALSLMFVGAAAPIAHATALTGVIIGAAVTSKVGFQDGTHIEQSISYCIPVDVLEGDTFTLTLPVQVGLGALNDIYFMTVGPIHSGTHLVVGKLTNDTAPYTYLMTFTKDAETYAGQCTTDTIYSGQLNAGLVQNNQPTDVTLVYSEGSAKFPVTITVAPTPSDLPFILGVVDEFGNTGATPATASSLGSATSVTVNVTVTNTGTKPLTGIYVDQDSLISLSVYHPSTCVSSTGQWDWTQSDVLQPGVSIVCSVVVPKVVPGTMLRSEATVVAQLLNQPNGDPGQSYEMHTMYYATNVAPAPVSNEVHVGEYVWNDKNKDGVKDANEPGIPGVTVNVSRTDSLGVTGADGQPVTSLVTDAQGRYDFALQVLPASVYYQLEILGPPNGYFPTSGSSYMTAYGATGDGTSDMGMNFGYYQPAPAITITKSDVNGNAADTPETAADLGYEPGSTGLVFTITNTGNETLTNINVTDQVIRGGIVSAINCDYPYIGPLSVGDGTTSNAGGQWDGSLNPGRTITCTATLTQVMADVMHHDDGKVTAVGVDSGTSVEASNPYFAKVKAAVSVGYTVWLDTNRNGTQDNGELGISGITLTVVGPTGAAVIDLAGKQVQPVTTDTAGHYVFTNLPALPAGQHYTVTVVTATGFNPTPGNTGKAVSTDLTVNGSSDMSLNFGFYPDTPVTTIDTGLPGMSGTAVSNIASGIGLIILAMVGAAAIRIRRKQT